jgi:D-alanyl-D-alanine carboxypeptidase
MLLAPSGVAFASGGTLDEAPQLELVVKSALQEFGVPGAAIGVWTPRGQWKSATGLGDVAKGRPVSVSDHFAIRSVTKSFTVTLVMQLVDDSHGTIGLDDPIGKYLDKIPNGENITIRELANMTSGLFNYTRDDNFLNLFVQDLTRTWTNDELLSFAFDGTTHNQINFAAGTQYEYSNTNTLVLGKLVEALTERPFEAVLGEKILDPLDLSSTAFLHGTKLPRPASHGYNGLTEDGQPAEIVASFSSQGFAGAMVSSLHDLGKWGRALATGSLLPADLQRQRFVANSTAADVNSPLYDHYGMGMGEVAGWWGHTGDGLGFEAAVLHQIERRETIAILLNQSAPSNIPVRIFCRILGVLDESPAPDSGSLCAPGNARLLLPDSGSEASPEASQ